MGIFVVHFTTQDREIQYSNVLWVSRQEKNSSYFRNWFSPTSRPPEKTRPDEGTDVQLRPQRFGVFCFSSQALFAFLIASSTATIPAKAQRSALKNKTSHIGETFQLETILKPWYEAGTLVFFIKSLEVVDKVNEPIVFRVVFVQTTVAPSCKSSPTTS